jgi:ankyrin repeat protein
LTNISSPPPTNLGTNVPFDARRDQTPMATRPKKCRFFAISLRQFLLLIGLCAVLLGIVAPRIRQTLRGWELQEDFDKRAAVAAELVTAVSTDDVALARHALSAGADPNLDPHQQLLGSCIVHGQVEMTDLLLEFGADIEEVQTFYLSLSGSVYGPPVFIAAGCNQPPKVRSNMIRLLVAHGADPRRQLGDMTAMDLAFRVCDARTADLLREYGLPYGPREMAGFNRVDELKRAVERERGIVKDRFRPTCWVPPGQEPTLLAIALERGYREMSLFLVESGAPLDTTAYYGDTLLHLAARSGDPELIRQLVARGLDVNAVNHSSETPLSEIAWRNMPEVLTALVKAGAKVNHHGWLGGTPLHHAAQNNRMKIVRILLAAGADSTIADEYGLTPLDVARTCSIKNPSIVSLFEQATASKRNSFED